MNKCILAERFLEWSDTERKFPGRRVEGWPLLVSDPSGHPMWLVATQIMIRRI